MLAPLLIKKTKVRGWSDSVSFFWVRIMPLISLGRWLISCRQFTSEVPENETWLINEEQHSSPWISSNLGAVAVHSGGCSVLLVQQQQNHIRLNLLACGWIDLQWPPLLSLVTEEGGSCSGDNTSLPILWQSSEDTWSCVTMAMEEEFGRKLVRLSLVSCSLPHPDKIPKLFWCGSLKLSLIICFLNPLEGDRILFTLISILSLWQ